MKWIDHFKTGKDVISALKPQPDCALACLLKLNLTAKPWPYMTTTTIYVKSFQSVNVKPFVLHNQLDFNQHT